MLRTRTVFKLSFTIFGILLLNACGSSGPNPFQAAGSGSTPPAGVQQQESETGNRLLDVIMQPQLPLDDGLKGISLAGPTELLDQIPDPADLKSTLCAGSGWFLEGGGFTDDLPTSNVERSGELLTEGHYAPDYDGLALDTASYAIYRWNLRGYTGEQTVGFSWVLDQAPLDGQLFYIGFGNLQQNRWEFYEGPSDNVLTIESFGPYRAASGDVLMTVLMLGMHDAGLAYMQAGVPEQRATGDLGLPETAPAFPLLAANTILPELVDMSKQCSPVNDQRQWGACTAFAVGDSAYNHELGQTYGELGWDLRYPQYRVSPKYLYVNSGELEGIPPGGGYGRWTDQVIDNLMTDGVATELHAPYNNIYDNNWSTEALADAAVLHIESWMEIPCNTPDGVENVKRVLAEQGKVLPMRVYLDYSFLSLLPAQVWYYTYGTVGGHAMCIVGYDDSKGISGAFKVRNSWGPFWGDSGYVWIGYESFLNPYASIRCWTMNEDYGEEVIQHFNLARPAVIPVTGLHASAGTIELGIELSWNEHPAASEIRVYRDSRLNLVEVLPGSATSWLDETVADAFGHVYWLQADASSFGSPATGYIASQPQILEIVPIEGIEGDSLTLGASITGSGPLEYAWDFGDAGSSSNPDQPRPILTLGSPGVYDASLTVSNPIGSDSYDFQFTVQSIPVVVQYISHTSGFGGDVVQLQAITNGTPSSFMWDFGGAGSPAQSTEPLPQLTLGTPGRYEASLAISNANGEDVFNFYISVLDPADSSWPTVDGNWRNSRQSNVNGPATANLAWRFFAGISGNSASTRISAVLALDNGNLVFSADNNSSGSCLWCLAADGSLQWRKSVQQNSYRGQPSLGKFSGQLYCSLDGKLQAIDPLSGTLLWEAESTTSGGLNIVGESPGGTVYALAASKYLVGFAVDDGSQIVDPIQFNDKAGYVPETLITDEGMIYIMAYFGGEHIILVVDGELGLPVDSLHMPERLIGMALSPDGITMFATDKYCRTRAIDLASCNELWKQQATSSLDGNPPAVMADGTVIVLNGEGLLSALDPNTGEILWSFAALYPDEKTTGLVIGRDGTVYYGSNERRIYAVRDGVLQWQSPDMQITGFNGAGSLGGNGNYYISNALGWLCCFGPGSAELLIPPTIIGVDPLAPYAGVEQTFTAEVIGNEPLSYAWDFGSAAIPSLSSDAAPLVTTNTLPGFYICSLTLSNPLGSYTYDFNLNLTEAPSGPRWESYVLGDYGNATEHIVNESIIDGKPAMLVWEDTNNLTHYMTSSYTDPQNAASWQSEDLPVGVKALSLAEIGGEPATLGFDVTDLVYLRRTAGSWSPHILASVDSNGGSADLALVNGKPGVVFARQDAAVFRPVYARSTALYPASSGDWLSMDIADNDTSSGDRLQLEDLGGVPHIAFRSKYNAAWHLGYAVASAADPSLPTDWSWHTVDTVNDATNGFALLMYDGLPMLTYSGSGSPEDLLIARASSISPAADTDWAIHSVETRSSVWARRLIELDSRPAVGYESLIGNTYVTIARALADEPAAPADWDVERMQSGIIMHGMLNVAGNPAFIIEDGNTDELIYLHWIPN